MLSKRQSQGPFVLCRYNSDREPTLWSAIAYSRQPCKWAQVLGGGHSEFLLSSVPSAFFPLQPSRRIPWCLSFPAFPATCSQQELQALRTKGLLDPGDKLRLWLEQVEARPAGALGLEIKAIDRQADTPWGAKKMYVYQLHVRRAIAWTGGSKRRLLVAIVKSPVSGTRAYHTWCDFEQITGSKVSHCIHWE
jgi:hypothetical protein